MKVTCKLYGWWKIKRYIIKRYIPLLGISSLPGYKGGRQGNQRGMVMEQREQDVLTCPRRTLRATSLLPWSYSFTGTGPGM